MTLFELMGKIAIDNTKANSEIDKTTEKAEGSSSKMSGAFKKIGAALAAAFTADKIVSFGKACVSAAAEVSAEASAFEQIMGKYADEASAKVNKIADATGMTDSRLTPYMTSMTAKFKGLGYDIEESTDLASTGLTIAADAAAFWDKSLDDSMSALNSFVNGNYEGGEAIGLFANETTLASWAAQNLGMDWQSLTEKEKQFARLEFAKAMQEASGATGQAAKESGQYANVLGNLQEAWRQFKAAIGEPILQQLVLPAMSALQILVQGAADKINALNEYFAENEAAARILESGIKAVLVALAGFATIKGIQSLTGYINAARVATLNYAAATQGASLASGVANGNFTRGQAIIGTLANKIVVATSKIITFTTTTVADTAAQTLNAVAKSKVGTAASAAAAKVIAFATANKIAIIAALGLAAPIILLAGYMMKTGASAEDVAAKITGFADKLAGMITQFANAFPSMVDSFVSALTNVINSIVTALPTLIPALIQAGIQLFMALLQSLTQIIEPLVATLPQIINAIVSALPVLIPALIQAGITLFMALVDAIPKIIPPLVAAIPQIVNSITSALPVLIPALLQGAVQLFMAFVQAIPEIVPALLAALPLIVSAVWNGLVVALNAIWEAIKSAASAAWEAMKDTASSLWEGIKSAITDKIQAAKDKVASVINSIKSTVSNVFNGIKSTASNVWNSIKTAITNPIETAKNVVKSAIDKIRSFFNFSWKLPHLKLPHLKASGKFSLVPPSVPKFSIKWYKDAMDKAMLLNSPTIFGMNQSGQFLGGGEAGQEVVVGSQTLMNMIKTAVNGETTELAYLLQKIIELLADYMPQLLEGNDLYLDGDMLVGGTAARMNKAIGDIAAQEARIK